MTLTSVPDHTGVFRRIILPGRCYRKFRHQSHGKIVTLLLTSKKIVTALYKAVSKDTVILCNAQKAA